MRTLIAAASRRRARGPIFVTAMALALAACATGGLGGIGSSTGTASPVSGGAAPAPGWRVNTREDVDLWLHGFAMLTTDTGRVTFFSRGYKQRITAIKRQKNILTALDANQPQLSARVATNPSLTNAQFLAMYFPSLQEIANATDLFIRAQGNPRASNDPQMQQEIALLASLFPSAADRDWLRLFVQSIQDEDSRFYHAYWTSEQGARGAGYAQFQAQWQSTWYPKLSRFLNNTQQPDGELLLSLPLGGEGRTVNQGKLSNIIAVTYPTTPDSAANALFVFAHEAVQQLVQVAINDNTTPAEQRSGATNGYQGNAAVRGGAMLIQKTIPDLLPAYMRFYLETLGPAAPRGDTAAAFAAGFPLPSAIVTAIGKQIDIVLGGI